MTAERIADYQRARLAEQAKAGTVNRELRILRRAFNLAVNQKKLLKSSVPKFVLFSEEDAVREGFVEKGQLLAIASHLDDADVRDYVLWGFWSGMRKGEIAKLSWAAFDKETWTLTLPGRITKNKKPRKLALEGPYREIVKRRLAVRRLDCPLIFHRDGQPMKSFRKAWKRACSQAGVPALLFHDLRRTSIRNMIRAGIDRKIARMISGHRTESIFTCYDITDDDLRDAVLKIEQYVSGLPAVSTVVPLESAKVAQP